MTPLLDSNMPLKWRVQQVYILCNGSRGTYMDALQEVLAQLNRKRDLIEEQIKGTKQELRRAARVHRLEEGA
jgi:hypothetical protein